MPRKQYLPRFAAAADREREVNGLSQPHANSDKRWKCIIIIGSVTGRKLSWKNGENGMRDSSPAPNYLQINIWPGTANGVLLQRRLRARQSNPSTVARMLSCAVITFVLHLPRTMMLSKHQNERNMIRPVRPLHGQRFRRAPDRGLDRTCRSCVRLLC